MESMSEKKPMNPTAGQQTVRPALRPTDAPKQEPMPPTYLVWSIVMTVLCCLVPGIVAIIFSSQVSGRYYAGDIEGARRSSRNAEIWIIISFVLGVLSATLYLPIALIN
ncbi:MAG: CD225/dispanin family protein [Muribaculaceae bacterium]|nr:CD225/dispanin family protein [Muribaculaceae bacterium]